METVRDTETFWIENYTTNFYTTTTMVMDLWGGFEHVTTENQRSLKSLLVPKCQHEDTKVAEKEALLGGKRPPSPVEGGGSSSMVMPEKQCCCAVASDSYSFGYCRWRLGHGISGGGWGLISFLSPFLSRCGFSQQVENIFF